MNILLIGPPENNSTDGVIIKGIKYLLNRSYPDCHMYYVELKDTKKQNLSEFKIFIDADLVVVCGTPWLWDSFQKSIKYKNLWRCFVANRQAKKLFMGIGSCLYFKDIKSDILEREEEVSAMRLLLGGIYGSATVITRDHLVQEKLTKAGIKATHLPCPAYFCYGDESTPSKVFIGRDVLIWQDPTKSISAGDWHGDKLAEYHAEVLEFNAKYSPDVYCANENDIEAAIAIGLPTPTVLKSSEDTLNVMRKANRVLSGRVHCAVPALLQKCDVTLMPLDTRSYVVTDFLHVSDFTPYLEDYDRILKSIFERRVGTESQRTYKEYLENGFFDKYMTGIGLDIGFAGYTAGAEPILPTALGIDKDYPGYDGQILPFSSESQDYVYSSHCLEHIEDSELAIEEWFRVLKPNGYMVLIVPHMYLYEKKAALPSNWNLDHKRFYTPGSLLIEIENALPPNSYRVRLLEDGDRDFNYSLSPKQHSSGQYEIILIIQKILPPIWGLAD